LPAANALPASAQERSSAESNLNFM